jgi:transaldolase
LLDWYDGHTRFERHTHIERPATCEEIERMTNRLQQLSTLGQAIWLDYIDRALLTSGKLQALVDEGLSGMTSNPTIFQRAISQGKDYADDIERMAGEGCKADEIYESLAISDIGAAADILRPVFDSTEGRDGYVSLEVRPELAHNPDGTIEEAMRLYKRLNRPNIMIKVPATEACCPAITELIGQGINVNVTLIFSRQAYVGVIEAFLAGLRRLRGTGAPLKSVASVASFFVSRVDTAVDQLLQARIDAGQTELEPLLGRAAVANAKVAYETFEHYFKGPAFAEFSADGARVQRPLWASTSTKNPAYSPTLYVDTLIGPHTVNTVPPNTLELIREQGIVAQTIDQNLKGEHELLKQLEAAGIDLDQVTDQLLEAGLASFSKSFDDLIAEIESKRSAAAV